MSQERSQGLAVVIETRQPFRFGLSEETKLRLGLLKVRIVDASVRLQFFVYEAAAADGVNKWKERVGAEIAVNAAQYVARGAIKIARISNARFGEVMYQARTHSPSFII